jgi:hypothetical protein
LIVDQVKPAILKGTAVRFDLSKGKGIAAKISQWLGDQEEDYRPRHQKSDGVDQSVESGRMD